MTVRFRGAGPSTHRARVASNFTRLPFQTTGFLVLGGRQPVVRVNHICRPAAGGIGLAGQQ